MLLQLIQNLLSINAFLALTKMTSLELKNDPRDLRREDPFQYLTSFIQCVFTLLFEICN